MTDKYVGPTSLAELWSKVKSWFVKKSGDTMTGDLAIKDTTIDRDGSNPSDIQYSKVLRFDDKDGERIGYFGAARETDGRVRLMLYAYNENDDIECNAHVNICIDKDGGGAVGIGHEAPESGLEVGYAATFDDWITAYKSIAAGEGSRYYANTIGQLICGKYNYINNYPFIVGDGTSNDDRHNCFYIDSTGAFTALGSPTIKSTDMQRDVSPGSSSKEKNLYFRDKNGSAFGWVGAIQNANSTNHAMRIVTQRNVNGTNKHHIVNVGIDINGNAVASVSGDGAQAAWRNALGAVNKAGDTMTSSLIIKSSNINRDTSNPSSDQWGSGLTYHDADGENIAGIVPARRSTGQMSVGLYAYNEKTDGTQVNNGMVVYVARDGTCVYSVSSPSAFRSAIGAAASSDKRLKEDISPLGDEAVSFVEDLEPVVYTINGERQVGFIAQDVDAADPWGTNMAFESQEGLDGLDDWERMPDGSSTWKLDYIRTIPPIAAALKRAMKRIDQLEERVSELESMLGGSNA